MKVDVIELFPTVVMSFNLNRDLYQRENEIIERELKNTGRNEGNWTSRADQVFEEDGMQNLSADIMKMAYIYFDHVFKSKNTPEFYYVQSWLNVTHSGEFHHAHCHTNSFLSGCYYYKAEEGDCVRFHNLAEQNKMLYFPPKENTKYNARTRLVPIKSGDVVIWKSELHHDVPRLEKERQSPRISLAFNIFLKGNIGEPELRTGLHIG